MFNIITCRKDGLCEYIEESKRLITCYFINNNVLLIPGNNKNPFDCFVCNTWIPHGKSFKFGDSDFMFCCECGHDISHGCVKMKKDIITKIMYIDYLFLPDLTINISTLTKNVILI